MALLIVHVDVDVLPDRRAAFLEVTEANATASPRSSVRLRNESPDDADW